MDSRQLCTELYCYTLVVVPQQHSRALMIAQALWFVIPPLVYSVRCCTSSFEPCTTNNKGYVCANYLLLQSAVAMIPSLYNSRSCCNTIMEWRMVLGFVDGALQHEGLTLDARHGAWGRYTYKDLVQLRTVINYGIIICMCRLQGLSSEFKITNNKLQITAVARLTKANSHTYARRRKIAHTPSSWWSELVRSKNGARFGYSRPYGLLAERRQQRRRISANAYSYYQNILYYYTCTVV